MDCSPNFVEIPLRQVFWVRQDGHLLHLKGLYTHRPIPSLCQQCFSLQLLLLLLLLLSRLEAFLDAPCASLVIPVVRRLHQSFRFLGPKKPRFFQVVARFKWWWRRRRRQRRTDAPATPFPGSYFMPMALEADLLRPLGDVSCAKAPPHLVPWLPEQSDRGLAPVARGFRWSSSTLLPCGDDTVLNDPPLVYDLFLNLHIKGNCLCNRNCSTSVGRNDARRTCRNSDINGGGGIAACGCITGALIPTLPPSSSNALGANSLRCASSNKLPVHRSPGGNRLIVRAFTTVVAGPYYFAYVMIILQPSSHASPGSCGSAKKELGAQQIICKKIYDSCHGFACSWASFNEIQKFLKCCISLSSN